jgi:hypothetical protein
MALVIEVKVVPSSGRVLWKLEEGDRLKCYLKSPPEKGKANKELLGLISKALKLPISACAIISGATSRVKRLRIETEYSFNELLSFLGVERQMRLF